MASGQADEPKVANFKDHQVITPDTRKLRRTAAPCRAGESDPGRGRRAGAQAAVRPISQLWMNDECTKLDAARRQDQGQRAVKGDQPGLLSRRPRHQGRPARRCWFSEVVRAADSLCRLIDHSPESLAKIPMAHHRPACRRDPRASCASMRRDDIAHDRGHADRDASRGDRRVPARRESAPARGAAHHPQPDGLIIKECSSRN